MPLERMGACDGQGPLEGAIFGSMLEGEGFLVRERRTIAPTGVPRNCAPDVPGWTENVKGMGTMRKDIPELRADGHALGIPGNEDSGTELQVIGQEQRRFFAPEVGDADLT